MVSNNFILLDELIKFSDVCQNNPTPKAMRLSKLATFMALMVWSSMISHLSAMSLQEDSSKNASYAANGNMNY